MNGYKHWKGDEKKKKYIGKKTRRKRRLPAENGPTKPDAIFNWHCPAQIGQTGVCVACVPALFLAFLAEYLTYAPSRQAVHASNWLAGSVLWDVGKQA